MSESTARRKRIAIIGAGAHARDQHYPPLHALDEVELVAACDLVPAKVEEVRRQYGIPAGYTDYREMVEKEAPDGVVIVMRPMELTSVALACLDLGANLMVEKPPGCNLRETQRILDRARDRDCKAMVSLNRRFMPAVRELKGMASDRGLVYCSMTYNKDGFYAGDWTWPSSLPLADSIHLIDLMRFLGGEVAEVHAVSESRNADFTNAHSALLVFESGAVGTVNTHHCVGARVHRFEVHALGMSAYLDVGNTSRPECELLLDGKPAEPSPYGAEVPEGVGVDNYYETRHFARYVAGEEQGEATLADAFESVRLAEAIAAGHRGELGDFVAKEQ